MSYAAAIDQLNSMTPELHTGAGQPRRKFSLDQVRTLLHALGDPQLRFPAVLIAGTNGKGSTAATLASILAHSGLRTGLYTSPHLERPNERIRLNGVEISDDAFAETYFRVRGAAEALVASGELPQHPSFFEILTAQAFLYFAERKADIAVLEVGMGGRLDATNVVEPLLSIITDISLDHMEWLGSTIAAIAAEKAGILRRNGVMVTLPQHPEANQVLGEVATRLEVRGVNAAAYMPATHESISGPYPVQVLGESIEVDSPLSGAHQHRNLALAIAAAVELAERHALPVTAAAIAQGIRTTVWPGRLERIVRGPITWILDVAHNPAGAWALRAGFSTMVPESLPHAVVFSCLRDKPITELAQILFPLFDEVILAPIHAARAASMEELLDAARLTGTPATAAGSVREAVQLAAQRVPQGAIVVSGSVYLVGEARGILLRHSEASA
jgi:dihydrofolate synthase / folylpolyglutamate synthase